MFKAIFEYIPKKRIVADFIFAIVFTIFECYFVTILAEMTGSAISNNDGFIKLIFFYFIYLISWELSEYLGDINTCMSSTDIENNIGYYYFEKLYHIEPSILKKNNTGYISGLTHKLVGYKNDIYRQLIIFVPITMGYIIYFAYQLLKYHYTFSLLLIILCILSTSIKIIGNKIAKKSVDEITLAEANRNKLYTDTIININTAQKMQAKNFFLDKFKQEANICTKKTFEWIRLDEAFFCLFKLIMHLFCPLSLLILYFLPNGTIDNMPTFLSLIGLLSVKLAHTTKGIATALVYYQKFKSTYDKLEELTKSDNYRKEIEQGSFYKAELKDIVYSYKMDLEDVSKNVTIKIDNFLLNKGDKICVHGESGQGKTTLLHLLSNEIQNTNVYINDKNTETRLDCVFISQDTEIFDMSLRDNLLLGKQVSDEILLEYIEAVGLKDWFNKQKDGLDTLLGERGVFVSTGQRQRFNLIRGLLIQDKEVYLLDEPTSNVDEDTEEKMINLINKVLYNKTV